MCLCAQAEKVGSKAHGLFRDLEGSLSGELSDFIIEKAKEKGSLIVVLHKIQNYYGFIPERSIQFVAQSLNLSVAKVLGVISFYHYFKLKKPGKFKIQVCMGTACYLKGADDLLSGFTENLKINSNETTADGVFSLETVRCVGCCGLAPVVLIGNDVYSDFKREKIPETLALYVGKKGRVYAEV